MTLKEKFTEQSIHIRYQVLEPEKFQKIADDYAIEFAKFLQIHCINTGYLNQYFFKEKEHHITSLLEIFKKEKGL